MTTRDKQIGQNLAVLRGSVTQKELAERMKSRGWKWSQATVWTVETGERPLRLAEAQDIAEILDLGIHGVDRLTTPEGDARVTLHVRQVMALHVELMKSIAAFREGQFQLALAADEYPPATGQDQLSVKSWLNESPTSIARQIYEKEQAEGEVEMRRSNLDPDKVERMSGRYIDLFGETWKSYGEHSKAP